MWRRRDARRGARLPLPARYAPRRYDHAAHLVVLFAIAALVVWLAWPSGAPLPPLADDAQRFVDCTMEPTADGCAVWPR